MAPTAEHAFCGRARRSRFGPASSLTVRLGLAATRGMAIRLVLFDAFSTLLTPRLPVYVQYAETFEPFLGALDPAALRTSFKIGAHPTWRLLWCAS